ncbi:MAG: sulfur reduction protein DsrE [Desulfobacterales bacterium]
MNIKFKSKLSSILLSACILLTSATMGMAGDYKALKDVQSVKTVFDFRDGNPEYALVHIKLLHDTYKDKAIRDVTDKPDFVVVFMAGSVKLLSNNRESFSPEEIKFLEEMDNVIKAMAIDGIHMEICAFAANFFTVDLETVSPLISRVDNGWISSIGYQAKGYTLVPVY